MLGEQFVLAVIPARGGSKRVPRKNIRLFRGEPLIAWTIYAAMDSKYVDKVVVSTEDAEIAHVARLLGAEVIDRPAELATDTATSEDVLRHALTVKEGFAWVVLLQPTSPLRTSKDIDACIDQLQAKRRNTSACISVAPDGKTNGAVYVAESSWLQHGHNFNTNYWKATYLMPAERSLDIDTEDQLNG